MPAKGEVILIGQQCKGCHLCVHFCAKGCLSVTDKLSPQGISVPLFAPAKCNGCGICGRMCPDFAIEVYKTS